MFENLHFLGSNGAYAFRKSYMYLNFCVAKIFEIFSTIIWRLPHQITTNFELWICEFFLKCYIFVLIFFTTKKTNLLLIEKPLTYEAFFLSLEQFYSFLKLNFFLQRKRVTYINFLFINDDQLLLVNDVTIWSNKVFTIEWKLHTFFPAVPFCY